MYDDTESPGCLPGTTPAPRGLFLDLWGTLVDLPDGAVPEDPAAFRIAPDTLDALFRAHRAGWRLYVVGNVEAVAFGEVEEARWQAAEDHLLAQAAAHGAPIVRSYACTEHPRGVRGRRNDSVFLLPNTGAFYHAAHHDKIDVAKSWTVGDSTLELVAAWRAGVHRAAVRTGLALADRAFEVEVDATFDDVSQTVDALLRERPIRVA